MVTDLFARYDFTGVHPVVLYGLGLLSALSLIDGFMQRGSTGTIVVAFCMSWALAAPYCMKWARQGKLSVTWAFAIGIIFGLPGFVAYWIYFKMKGGDKGGISAW